jgi:hypothetical protein
MIRRGAASNSFLCDNYSSKSSLSQAVLSLLEFWDLHSLAFWDSLFLVGMFALLGDFGLTSSFIQRKDELTESDLQVGFTIQQILISLVVLALLLVLPRLLSYIPRSLR